MDELLNLISKFPKHYAVMAKKNPDITKWVISNSKLDPNAPWVQHIASAIHHTDAQCTNGKMMKFKNVAVGFGFCGPTSICECARQQVSEKVKKSKASRAPEQIYNENQKRVQTSLHKYGVTNNGQIIEAKNAHYLVYQDQEKINKISDQIRKTKLTNHGNERFNNRQKAIDTCLSKYGVKNTWLLSDDNQNPNLAVVRDKSRLSELFPKYSVDEIAKMLNLHTQTIYQYLTEHGFREPYKSTFEQEIVHFLNNLGVTNIIRNTRKVISKELDIYLPDYKLAIEYNGIYWHHDKIPHITRTYHYDKFAECEKKGITLFSIFGNTWDDKKNIWKKKIQAKLSASEKIYARKTSIISLSPTETKRILNDHHIQGYCTSQVCYGLSYNSEVVAVMTFSKKRIGIGKDRPDNSYELVRYVTSKNVPGGASKLLSHFIKEHHPSSVYSYSDNQYSTGGLYKALGFSLERENKCGYWYYDTHAKKTYHRMNFTKYKLVKNGYDPALTEKEIMDQRGFLRIWDCGSKTWVLRIQ